MAALPGMPLFASSSRSAVRGSCCRDVCLSRQVPGLVEHRRHQRGRGATITACACFGRQVQLRENKLLETLQPGRLLRRAFWSTKNYHDRRPSLRGLPAGGQQATFLDEPCSLQGWPTTSCDAFGNAMQLLMEYRVRPDAACFF